jgi:DNA-binding transcriptional MerR regulator
MRIGELAAAVGVSPATIRFYERSGVLAAPARTEGGYRDYSDRAVDELRFVRAGQAIGLTLLELSEIAAFRDRGEEPCTELVALMERRLGEVDERIRELSQLRTQLAQLVAAARMLDLADCPPATMYELLRPGAQPQVGTVQEIA